MEPLVLTLAGIAGFAAGLLDSIVGGGGLIMTPAMLNLFPGTPILQLIATQRTSSILGTSVAAWNYLRTVKLERSLLVAAGLGAMLASVAGALLAKRVPSETLKWVILGMCVVLAVYTFLRKDFGQTHQPRHQEPRRMAEVALLASLACGFYNGLIGPGTGTLMVFAYVSVLGLDFLHASATAKVANVAADLSSWTVLLLSGLVMWSVVLPLIIGNMLGSYVGSRLAILKGSRFIRIVFLVSVSALIGKLLWDLR